MGYPVPLLRPASQARPAQPARTWAAERWPARGRNRWLLRLACSLPWVALTLWAYQRGYVSPEQLALELRGDKVLSADNLSGLRYGYPPVPMLIAIVSPAGTIGLGIVAALAMGCVVAALAERLRRRDVPVGVRLALLATVVLTPAVWYLGSQNVTQTLTLAFLALSLEGFLRFAFLGETEGGFVAGLLMGAAFLCGPEALVYVVALSAAAPLVAYSRYRAERGASLATFAVLIFPSLALVVGWAFLEWRFAGTFYATVEAITPMPLLESVLAAVIDVTRAPLYAVVGVLFALRRPISVVGYLLPLFGLLITRSVGIAYPPQAGYLLLTLVALMTVPRRPGVVVSWVLVAVSVVQIIGGIVWTWADPGFAEWWDALV